MQRTCPNCGRSFRSHSGTVTCHRCGHTWGNAGKAGVYVGLGGIWLGACEGMGKEVGKVTKVVGPIVGDALVDVTEGLVRVLDEKIITPLLEWFKTKPPTKG